MFHTTLITTYDTLKIINVHKVGRPKFRGLGLEEELLGLVKNKVKQVGSMGSMNGPTTL